MCLWCAAMKKLLGLTCTMMTLLACGAAADVDATTEASAAEPIVNGSLREALPLAV